MNANVTTPVGHEAILHDGTKVEIVVNRFENDAHLADHWRIAIYPQSEFEGEPLMESYPLPPETHALEVEAVIDELLAEFNRVCVEARLASCNTAVRR